MIVILLTTAGVLALIAIWLYLTWLEMKRPERLEPLDDSWKRLSSQLKDTRRSPRRIQ